MVGKWCSFWEGLFSGAMLVSGGVINTNDLTNNSTIWTPHQLLPCIHVVVVIQYAFWCDDPFFYLYLPFWRSGMFPLFRWLSGVFWSCRNTKPNRQVSISFSCVCISVIFRSVSKGTVTIGNIWSDCSSPDLLCIIFSGTLEPVQLPPVTIYLLVVWNLVIKNRHLQIVTAANRQAGKTESQTIMTWLNGQTASQKSWEKQMWYIDPSTRIIWTAEMGLLGPVLLMGSFPPVPLAPRAYLESLRIIVRDAGCTVHALQDAVDGLSEKKKPSKLIEVNCVWWGGFPFKAHRVPMYVHTWSIILSDLIRNFIPFHPFLRWFFISPALRIAWIAFNL